MEILKNYKSFIKESVDSISEVSSMNDVPVEVKKIAENIANQYYDKVMKPEFEFRKGTGLVFIFKVTPQDFNYIDENEPLKLDLGEKSLRKRKYDVTLTYFDSISETHEVSYIVDFDLYSNKPTTFSKVDDDEDIEIEDTYYKPEEDDDYDEDIAVQNQMSKRNKRGRFEDDPDADIDYNIDASLDFDDDEFEDDEF